MAKTKNSSGKSRATGQLSSKRAQRNAAAAFADNSEDAAASCALTGDGFPQTIEGAVDPSPATIQYVRVDHRRLEHRMEITPSVSHFEH